MQVLNNARGLASQGRLQEAAQLLTPHVRANPYDADAIFLLAQIYGAARQWPVVIELAARLEAMRPQWAPTHQLSAQAFLRAGQTERAQASARKALSIAPNDPLSLNMLALALEAAGKDDEAIEAHERCAAGSTNPMFLQQAAIFLASKARLSRAVQLLRGAGNSLPVLHTLTPLLNYVQSTPEERFNTARQMGEAFEKAAASPPLHTVNDVGANRALRIGILSADLHTHSVANFLQSILEHFPREAGTLHIFSGRVFEDDVTRALREHAASWTNLHDSDRSIAGKSIAQANIDILLELGGHTTASRIALAPMRPAPVIVSYLGYPGATGMRSISARIVDHTTDTPGADAFFTERLYRMDRFSLCYTPSRNMPSVAARGPDHGITFGSFNSVLKLSDTTYDLWASVLNTVPGSTMYLKAAHMGKAAVYTLIREELSRRGVDPSRVTIDDFSARAEDHLRAYERVDIALDTAPYTGVSTTCEALMMGVPVVSLVGNSHHERCGLGILKAAGLEAFAAHTPQDYTRIAAELAGDPRARTQLRTSLREKVLASSLCDGKAHAQSFVRTLRQIWSDAGTNSERA